MELLETKSYAQVVKLTGISKSTLVREKKKRHTKYPDFYEERWQEQLSG